jgi:hypothetical protein
MNTRIFSASLFCTGLLCPALLAGCTVPIPVGTRPEIAQPLQEAQAFAERHDYADARIQILVAEAVPNQSDAEKEIVARVSWNITAGNIHFPNTGGSPYGNGGPPMAPPDIPNPP